MNHWIVTALIVGALFGASNAIAFFRGQRSQHDKIRESRRLLKKSWKKYRKREEQYKEKVHSVVDQLDKYADHIEENYMDADESSVIRSCSNMLRELVKDDE